MLEELNENGSTLREPISKTSFMHAKSLAFIHRASSHLARHPAVYPDVRAYFTLENLLLFSAAVNEQFGQQFMPNCAEILQCSCIEMAHLEFIAYITVQ